MLAHILIIDNEASIRYMLRQMLEQAGFQVLEAGTGQQGARICREENVGLLITDILMPEKKGLEAIRVLRRDFLDVKMIVMSALRGSTLFRALELGAERTFLKPFQPQELLTAVQDLLGKCV